MSEIDPIFLHEGKVRLVFAKNIYETFDAKFRLAEQLLRSYNVAAHILSKQKHNELYIDVFPFDESKGDVELDAVKSWMTAIEYLDKENATLKTDVDQLWKQLGQRMFKLNEHYRVTTRGLEEVMKQIEKDKKEIEAQRNAQEKVVSSTAK